MFYVISEEKYYGVWAAASAEAAIQAASEYHFKYYPKREASDLRAIPAGDFPLKRFHVSWPWGEGKKHLFIGARNLGEARRCLPVGYGVAWISCMDTGHSWYLVEGQSPERSFHGPVYSWPLKNTRGLGIPV